MNQQVAQGSGGQGWDDVVSRAVDASSVEATVSLGGRAGRIEVPFGLPALLSALLHFVAPPAPAQLRIYTWDVLGLGALLEVRGARELESLPGAMHSLAAQVGVKLQFSKQLNSASVLLTLPSPSTGNWP